jgi:RNA polymerase sigma factor (sigma-70 family)
VSEQDLIKACRNRDRRAQQLLYDRFAPTMLAVCKRYVKGQEDAEDVLIEAFYKVLTHLDQFKSEGSLEGWIRRIVVNEALMALRKRINFNQRVELTEIDAPVATSILQELAAKDILNLLDFLPLGYRTVFSLYALEGYKHREIAQHLGISINTSKSQLILAKKKLKNLLEQCRYPGIEWFSVEEEEETEEETEQAVTDFVPIAPQFN